MAVKTETPTPALEGLPHVEKQTYHAELATLRLVKLCQGALDEAIEKGGRAADLIGLYRRVYDAEEQLRKALTSLTAFKDLLKYKTLPEAYDREGISTLTTAERDRVTITQSVRASILAENRDKAYEWFRANGHGSLIIETVNSSTLTAFVKAELEQNHDLPEVIKVEPVETASLTRGNRPAREAA